MLVFKAWRKSPALTQETTPSQRRITRILSDAQQAAAREFGEQRARVAELLARGQVDRVVAMLPTEPWLVAQEALAAELLGELLDAGSRVTLPTIEKATLEYSFDRGRPESVSWARQQAGNLITQISADQRNVVRDIVALAATGDADWDDVAREVKGSIGLTTQQAGWVSNYYERAFAQQIRSGASSSQAAARAREQAARYQTSVHRYRANTIARTETMRAASEGRMQAWNQGITEGFISPLWEKEWVAEADACEICIGLGGTRVGVKQQFPVGEPPAHPNCRCDVILVPPKSTPAPATGLGIGFTDILFNLPIDDILFGLLPDLPLPRIPGWGPRRPTPEVTRPPEPPKFREPGDKPSFQDILDNTDDIFARREARALEDWAQEDGASLGDGLLYEIYKDMGYDGLPMVVDDDIFDQLAEGMEVWYRGIAGSLGGTAEDFLDALRYGDYYAGFGTFGNGTYTALDPTVALTYAGRNLGGVVRILLSPAAKVINADELIKMYAAWHQIDHPGNQKWLVENIGRFAAANGYDAIRVLNTGGVANAADQYMVILNRNLMVMPKSNGLAKVIDRFRLERAWNEAIKDDPSLVQTFGNFWEYARSRGYEAIYDNGRILPIDTFAATEAWRQRR